MEQASSLSSLTLLHMLFFYRSRYVRDILFVDVVAYTVFLQKYVWSVVVVFVVRRVRCFFTEVRQRSAILFVNIVAYAVYVWSVVVVFFVRRVHCFFTEVRQRSAILFVDVVAYAVFFFKYVRDRPY